MKDALVVGDTVQLKSGGPPMTVSSIVSKTCIECVWFNNDGDYDIAEFNTNTLVKIK